MPQLLDDFDPSVGSGQLNLGTKAGCARIRIWNESFFALVFQFQDGSQYLVPAWSMRTIQPHVPSPYVNWSIRATLTSTNPPATIVHTEVYSPSEFFDGVWTLALSRQTNVGNAIPVTSVDQLVNRDGLPGNTIIDIANSDVTDSTSTFLVKNDGTFTVGTVPALPGGTALTAFQVTSAGKVLVPNPSNSFEVSAGAQFSSAVDMASTLDVDGAITALSRILVQLVTEQLRLGYDASNYASFTVDSGGDLTVAPSGGDLNVSGNAAVSGNLSTVGDITTNDASASGDVTATGTVIGRNTVTAEILDTLNTGIPAALKIWHALSSGTPGAGMGVQARLDIDTNGASQRTAALWRAQWVDATDATRKSRVTFWAIGAGNREGVRIEDLGTATGLGFYGGNAVAKPTITGSRGGNAALASLLTNLASLGLITDSTTA